MDVLTLFLIIGFCGYVLFWYVTNLNEDQNGESGWIGINYDEDDVPESMRASWKPKKRIRPLLEVRQRAFRNRAKKGREDENKESAKENKEDLHAMRKVRLDIDQLPHGDHDEVEAQQMRFRKRERGQFQQKKPRHTAATTDKKTPR